MDFAPCGSRKGEPMTPSDIKKLFDKFGADLDRDDIWQVQSATVIKHKALERLAAAAKISFSDPVMVRAERDEAVVLVTGELDGRREWSIGEALVNVNYRVTGKMAAYVYAMAEKRAKDRVILKLAGLHGIYSEDEADEFKDAPRQSPQPAPAEPSPGARVMLAIVDGLKTRADVTEWVFANRAAANALPDGAMVLQHARERFRSLPEETAEEINHEEEAA